jgi:hypothetical protein
MMGNYQVRFGGGRMEKGSQDHLASRLPDGKNFRERSATVGRRDPLLGIESLRARFRARRQNSGRRAAPVRANSAASG